MMSQVAKIRGAAKLIALLLVMATMLSARALNGSTEAGLQISNRAEATYVDETGASYATVSPTVVVTVLAVINTNDVAAKSTLTLALTARSNATNAVNGRGEDLGTIINAVGLGARLTDPTDPNRGPSKLINGLAQTVVSRGGEFTYVIA